MGTSISNDRKLIQHTLEQFVSDPGKNSDANKTKKNFSLKNKVDGKNASLEVSRDQAAGAGKARAVFGKTAAGLTSAGKVTSKYAAATGKLAKEAHLEKMAENAKHVSHVSGATAGGLAVLTLISATSEIIHSSAEIKRGQDAQEQLQKAAEKINQGEVNQDDLTAVGQHTEAIARGEQARSTRIAAGLEFCKSGGEIAAVGLELTHHSLSAALVGGGAAGLVSIGVGAYKLHQAGKEQTAVDQKKAALKDAKKSEVFGRDAKAIKDAAKDIRTSREKHISNTKVGGFAKIGIGLASLGLMAAGVLAAASVIVLAPVVLPIAGIALVSTAVGFGVHGVVTGIGKKRSEAKINQLIKESVQSKGIINDNEKNKLLDNIKSKDRARDSKRLDKINAATVSINKTLDRLASLAKGDSVPPEKTAIIHHLTNEAFVKGSEKEILQNVLENLNPENINDHRNFLLTALTKNIL